ncbi:MAG: hypothetical protein JWM87_1341 [Candidatus Eremiobacteraeota bacterium]|nr:hypothetical protein [Candidatus Eremiobacteraeota bacterium]
MDHRLITYRAKPETMAEHERLIRGVFEELQTVAPGSVRYAVLRLDDDTFVHVVATEPGGFSVPSLDAFKRFQEGIDERRSTPVESRGATVVGNYRMLGDQSAVSS